LPASDPLVGDRSTPGASSFSADRTQYRVEAHLTPTRRRDTGLPDALPPCAGQTSVAANAGTGNEQAMNKSLTGSSPKNHVRPCPAHSLGPPHTAPPRVRRSWAPRFTSRAPVFNKPRPDPTNRGTSNEQAMNRPFSHNQCITRKAFRRPALKASRVRAGGLCVVVAVTSVARRAGRSGIIPFQQAGLALGSARPQPASAGFLPCSQGVPTHGR
jgi:hypothetical protein